MKKTLLIALIILALLLALPLVNFIRWSLQGKKPMNIILVDKTVPTIEREKHKAFSWILTNEAFVRKGSNKRYSISKDYYGFIPKRPVREKQWDKNDYRLSDLIKLAETNDVLYVADAYGVFFNDWWSGVNKSRKSRKLYGGLNNNDYLLLKEMKDKNRLIIMEFNSFDYPTPQFESVRTQEKLGISFSGWTGKYFSSLDSTEQDFPVWMTSMYRKQYNKPWTFTKPGIVLLSEKDIVVLEDGIQLKGKYPLVVTDTSWCQKLKLPSSVPFDQWFDIIDPLASTVVSSFQLPTTALGDSILADNGLSRSFPAVIIDAPEGSTYYFSGDFATSSIPYWTSKLKGIDKLKGVLYSEKADDPRRFFWFYYRPLMSSILNNYYQKLK